MHPDRSGEPAPEARALDRIGPVTLHPQADAQPPLSHTARHGERLLDTTCVGQRLGLREEAVGSSEEAEPHARREQDLPEMPSWRHLPVPGRAGALVQTLVLPESASERPLHRGAGGRGFRPTSNQGHGGQPGPVQPPDGLWRGQRSAGQREGRDRGVRVKGTSVDGGMAWSAVNALRTADSLCPGALPGTRAIAQRSGWFVFNFLSPALLAGPAALGAGRALL